MLVRLEIVPWRVQGEELDVSRMKGKGGRVDVWHSVQADYWGSKTHHLRATAANRRVGGDIGDFGVFGWGRGGGLFSVRLRG